MDKFFETIIFDQISSEIDFLEISFNLLEKDKNYIYNPTKLRNDTDIPFGSPTYKFFCLNNILNCMANLNKILSNKDFSEDFNSVYDIDKKRIPNIMSQDIRNLRNLNEHIDARLVDIYQYCKINNFNGFSDFNVGLLDANQEQIGIKIDKNFSLRLYDKFQNIIVYTDQKYNKIILKLDEVREEITYLKSKINFKEMVFRLSGTKPLL